MKHASTLSTLLFVTMLQACGSGKEETKRSTVDGSSHSENAEAAAVEVENTSVLQSVSTSLDIAAQNLGAVHGYVDGVQGEVLYGWICQAGSSSSLDYHIYAGGPAGSGRFVAAGKADKSSEEAIAKICGNNGRNHRFAHDLKTLLKEGKLTAGEKIYVHAINLSGKGPNNLISRSGVMTAKARPGTCDAEAFSEYREMGDYRARLAKMDGRIWNIVNGTADIEVSHAVKDAPAQCYIVELWRDGSDRPERVVEHRTNGAGLRTSLRMGPTGKAWYRYRVRGVTNNRFISEFTSARFATGKVYVAAGQSNAAYWVNQSMKSNSEFARVYSGDGFIQCDDSKVSRALTDSGNGAGSIWCPFADQFVELTHQPVAVYPAAYGGSASWQWIPGNWLFDRLTNIMRDFGHNGAEITWIQGETDIWTEVGTIAPNTRQAYHEHHLNTLMNGVRDHAGYSPKWLVALVAPCGIDLTRPWVNSTNAPAAHWQQYVDAAHAVRRAQINVINYRSDAYQATDLVADVFQYGRPDWCHWNGSSGAAAGRSIAITASALR